MSVYGRLINTYCYVNRLPQRRHFHISPRSFGADHGNDPIKNPKDIHWPNEVSSFEHYKLPDHLLDEEFNHPVCRDTMNISWPGYWFKRRFVHVKEMEPELIVPDLNGFELKPYVSYRAKDVTTEPLTAKALFDAVYKDKISEAIDSGEIVDDYQVSNDEINIARSKATQTGADLFDEASTS